jgi:hypothetical protein
MAREGPTVAPREMKPTPAAAAIARAMPAFLMCANVMFELPFLAGRGTAPNPMLEP